LVRPLAEEHDASLGPVAAKGNTVVLSERVLLRQALLALYTEAVQATEGAAVRTSIQPLGESHIAVRVGVPVPRRSRALDECGPIEKTMLEALRASCDVTSLEEEVVYTLRLPAASFTRVLLVDDNQSIHQLVRRYLVGHPYAMLSAFDADQALEIIGAEQPDVVILDVMMSGRDGWELLRLLRASAPLQEIPVIVCSVLEQAALAHSLGADAYLTKPVTQDALLTALGQLSAHS
jgi:CheY-like chemotaxis protein